MAPVEAQIPGWSWSLLAFSSFSSILPLHQSNTHTTPGSTLASLPGAVHESLLVEFGSVARAAFYSHLFIVNEKAFDSSLLLFTLPSFVHQKAENLAY
jgi:hypothetical protein